MTSETTLLSLAKCVSIGEMNKERPSIIYGNSCLPRLRPFRRLPPLPLVLNLTSFAMQQLGSHINPEAQIYGLLTRRWPKPCPGQMLSWHYKCCIVINLLQLRLTFWKFNTDALSKRKHDKKDQRRKVFTSPTPPWRPAKVHRWEWVRPKRSTHC